MPIIHSKNDSAADHLEKYSEYNRLLRSWFVAFGFGVPALFLVNEQLAQKLASLGELRYVAVLFLIGASAQVLMAFINKFVSWSCYFSEVSDKFSSTRISKFNAWLSDQFWIDVGLDVATMVTFGIGVWQVLTVFATSSSS